MLAILFFVVVVLIGVPFFFLFYRAPSCTDGLMNGDEKGVDCGGSCQRLCAVESLPIVSQGDPRVLFVAGSATTSRTYEVVALFDNPNQGASIDRARYTVTLYSAGSVVPMKTIEGSTYVPKGERFAVFVGPFALEEGQVPARAEFEWEPISLIWEKRTGVVPTLSIGEKSFSRLDSSPRLEVTVRNPSLDSVSNIDLTALLYDASGNIFAASRTFVEEIPATGETKAIFTWPRPFGRSAAVVEVIPRILPDRSYLR